MSIRKIKGLESDFTIVPNKTINDKLSWAARGMLLYLCSKPDNWEVNITDLVNQTTGSKKKSGRDAVRVIMSELIECGYMRKSQDRNIKGQFNNADHEVSFVPFTENPYAAIPTQESKDLNKEKKKILTDNSSSKRLVSVKDLGKDFQQCKDAYEYLSEHDWLYLGKLSIEEWSDCEDAMSSVDLEFSYFDWWVERYRNTFKKKPSLPNILSSTNKLSFSEFYENTYAK